MLTSSDIQTIVQLIRSINSPIVGQSSIQFKDNGTNLGTSGTVTAIDVIEKSDFVGAVDFPVISRSGNTLSLKLDSGEFVPDSDPGNFVNVDVLTVHQAQYMRVGDVVTVSGGVTLNATTANSLTVFTLSVPYDSAFSVGFQLGGSISSSSVPGVAVAYDVNLAGFLLKPNVATDIDLSYVYTYQII